MTMESSGVLDNLKSNYKEALSMNDVKVIVNIGRSGKFSGGFDISGFGEIKKGARKDPKIGYISINIINDLHEGCERS